MPRVQRGSGSNLKDPPSPPRREALPRHSFPLARYLLSASRTLQHSLFLLPRNPNPNPSSATMPVKRHCKIRSSSQGEISVFDRPPSPSAFIDSPKPPPAAKPHCALDVSAASKSSSSSPAPVRAAPKNIFALTSPDRKTEPEIDRPIGGFLEMCLFCKKHLTGNDNVFMYHSVSAFCTPECRARQIARDEENASRKSTKMDLGPP